LRPRAIVPAALAVAILLTAAILLAVEKGPGPAPPPGGFFGIAPQTPVTPADAARMRAGGVETIRFPLFWSSVQPTPLSKYIWIYYDELFETAARERLAVLPTLGGLPAWLSDYRRLPIDTPRRRQEWMAFVRAAVERYGPGGEFWREHRPGTADPLPRLPARSWEVWNEENLFDFTRPASPQRYARLLELTHRAVSRADPAARIIVGGLFGDPRQGPPRAMDAADFLEQLYRVPGVKSTFDAVALHPYASDTADLRRLVEEARQAMVRHGDAAAGLYITEMGWGSQDDPRTVAFEVGPRGQAQQLRAAYEYLLDNASRLNLKQVDWFSWKDVTGSCSFCDSSGLFAGGEAFRAKPAWRAFQEVARR
jgi:hypothetical protein